ncbi:AraC family transcriptional regulator [uncultured Psychroserpens sp.]|uniref:helix-turn-helix domain-containing protein n=1 Tax=uncultured Psychroserpens sp. TaxID=255436 RepID=UPI002608A3F5|nr:AraC family transcriptional regulator [uncultured Psychroserpens sp.]
MDRRIQKALDYIESNLSLQLTLSDLANVSCMSTSNFHRVFKKETGRTPFKFTEEIKMKKAYTMLISGSYKIHELTETFGYQDYETFTRAFKKYYALAPDDLKAIAQKIKSEMQVGPDGFIIKIFEVDSIDDIKENIERIILNLKHYIKDKGYSEEDIAKAKVMSIMPKIENSTPNEKTIKNKFVITENQKIWKTLLNLDQHGKH